MTLRIYATRKKWDLQKVIVHVDHGKEHASDSENTSVVKKIDTFKREIEIFGNLDDKQRQRLLEITDKCPVHKRLSEGALIRKELI